jgi:hypothetical protein
VFPPNPYSHLLNDETTGGFFLARSSVVDLYSFDDCQRVIVRGTLVSDAQSPQPILEVSQVELAPDPEPVTATFELSVEGQPPPQTTFFGVAAELGFGTGSTSAQLTDPDGDGVYTGAAQVPQGRERGIFIEQGMGVRENPFGFRFPGEPRSVIRDFGLVRFDGDKTFSASVSFEQVPPADGGSGSLPSTGGPPLVPPVLLLSAAGALLLVGGGLLARRGYR